VLREEAGAGFAREAEGRCSLERSGPAAGLLSVGDWSCMLLPVAAAEAGVAPARGGGSPLALEPARDADLARAASQAMGGEGAAAGAAGAAGAAAAAGARVRVAREGVLVFVISGAAVARRGGAPRGAGPGLAAARFALRLPDPLWKRPPPPPHPPSY
jgi:hypothetical protein